MMYSSVRCWTIGPKKIGGRTSQIRTGDLYHVKAHRTRHNTLGHVDTTMRLAVFKILKKH